MKTEVDVQRAAAFADVPPDVDLQTWVKRALAGFGPEYSLAVRIVGKDESQRLNREYRGIDAATNVLSFAADLPEEVSGAMRRTGEALPLGDLVICADVVAAEAADQGKPIREHWAHLVIHGILHLLGHDHDNTENAQVMENLEREFLAGMGIPDPYTPRRSG
jgi:probable rRNA maturation factor